MNLIPHHIANCNNARLPGGYLRLHVGASAVGWVPTPIAEIVAPCCEHSASGLHLADGNALAKAAARLVAAGLSAWRGEVFAVRADADDTVVARVDRGLLPALGLQAHNAHLNGLVRCRGGLHVWVAQRAAHKLVAPGKLDHIVAGGVPDGLTPFATLVKEAQEEAGIPPALAARAVAVGAIRYAREDASGLRREVLHCFDLDMPEDFAPVAVDGEVAGFALWSIDDVLAALRDTDDFMYDVNLALIDLLIRHQRIVGDEAVQLRRALDADAVTGAWSRGPQAGTGSLQSGCSTG